MKRIFVKLKNGDEFEFLAHPQEPSYKGQEIREVSMSLLPGWLTVIDRDRCEFAWPSEQVLNVHGEPVPRDPFR